MERSQVWNLNGYSGEGGYFHTIATGSEAAVWTWAVRTWAPSCEGGKGLEILEMEALVTRHVEDDGETCQYEQATMVRTSRGNILRNGAAMPRASWDFHMSASKAR